MPILNFFAVPSPVIFQAPHNFFLVGPESPNFISLRGSMFYFCLPQYFWFPFCPLPQDLKKNSPDSLGDFQHLKSTSPMVFGTELDTHSYPAQIV